MSDKITLLNQHPYVSIKMTKDKGRGIFARKAIKKNTVFLIDPIVIASHKDLNSYIFEHDKKVFVALGMGSLINHSSNPNCWWSADVNSKSPTITFTAYEDIEKGEELLHDYSWESYPKGFSY
jgi:uncharacterized protein